MNENKLNILEQFFKIVENLTGFLDKFGILKLFKTVFVVVVVYWLVIISFNPSKIFQMYEEYQEKIHKEKIEDTFEKQYLIKNNVIELHYATNAMRTLVLCCHNGSESLTGDYQFLKCSALFEECGENSSVMEEYQNIHITQFYIFSYLRKNEVFCGTLEELKKIDSKLYYRLLPNGVNYIHIQSLLGEHGNIVGFLVQTWEKEPENKEKMHQKIYTKCLNFSRLM